MFVKSLFPHIVSCVRDKSTLHEISHLSMRSSEHWLPKCLSLVKVKPLSWLLPQVSVLQNSLCNGRIIERAPDCEIHRQWWKSHALKSSAWKTSSKLFLLSNRIDIIQTATLLNSDTYIFISAPYDLTLNDGEKERLWLTIWN